MAFIGFIEFIAFVAFIGFVGFVGLRKAGVLSREGGWKTTEDGRWMKGRGMTGDGRRKMEDG